MSKPPVPSAADLARENEELRFQLQEAEELITAIRTGAVDALAVQGPDGPRIFTLEGADQSYRTLIEQMNEGAVLLSHDATILYANAYLANWLAQPLEALIGSSFAALVAPEGQERWAGLFAAGWRGSAKGELPLHTRAAPARPLALSMTPLEFNGTAVLAVILTDQAAQREIQVIQARISAQDALIEHKDAQLLRQQAERQAVEHAAAEARRLLEGLPHIAWTANPAGHNTYLNRRWFDYIGEAPTPEFSPERIYQLVHPDDVEPAMRRWEQILASGEPLEVECRIRNAAGHYRWMLGRALPSRNEQGDIVEWIGTYTDIHEHKLAQQRIAQAQQQLQENNARLLRANVDLDNFIYTASHDLKAPINNIEGLLHALQGELPPAIGQHEPVEPLLLMMQDSIDRFKRTIEHLTEVTKLQKEYAAPAVVIDLAALIDDVARDLDPLVRAVDGELTVDVEDHPHLLFAEKNLRSIVYNLLSNAFKYHVPGRPPRVRISCHGEGRHIRLTVQDNGLGLNLAGSQKLFSMFQRFHDHVEGSGIGLYMVKKILENAGGSIEVHSEVGVGSVFSALFPR
ncbi:ATP-binding protein [Hymenobacter sp. B81]|uniref:sensor histidine kinase n=1 Tax=Hymenobacter sp. B81 TaxID=3344878 RepID=UPI0037DCB061